MEAPLKQYSHLNRKTNLGSSAQTLLVYNKSCIQYSYFLLLVEGGASGEEIYVWKKNLDLKRKTNIGSSAQTLLVYDKGCIKNRLFFHLWRRVHLVRKFMFAKEFVIGQNNIHGVGFWFQDNLPSQQATTQTPISKFPSRTTQKYWK